MQRIKPQAENPWKRAKELVSRQEVCEDTILEDYSFWNGYGHAVVDLGVGTEEGRRDFDIFIANHFNTSEPEEPDEESVDLKREKREEEQRELEAELKIHDDNSLGHSAEDWNQPEPGNETPDEEDPFDIDVFIKNANKLTDKEED